ncbi:hypothetical protein V8C86DRAFT_2920868 [Haematococcus lacustris]
MRGLSSLSSRLMHAGGSMGSGPGSAFSSFLGLPPGLAHQGATSGPLTGPSLTGLNSGSGNGSAADDLQSASSPLPTLGQDMVGGGGFASHEMLLGKQPLTPDMRSSCFLSSSLTPPSPPPTLAYPATGTTSPYASSRQLAAGMSGAASTCPSPGGLHSSSASHASQVAAQLYNMAAVMSSAAAAAAAAANSGPGGAGPGGLNGGLGLAASPGAARLLASSGGSLTAAGLPGRFKAWPLVVQQRVLDLVANNPILSLRDFDDKVTAKICTLVETYGKGEALAMLDHLEHRMRTKQGTMKNGPGYLDVAVCSHIDMLKAQGSSPKNIKLEDYSQQVLPPPVHKELVQAVTSNRWLAWEHFDQGVVQLIKRLPTASAVEKLQEISYHSFKNVDNIKGCIMSILNSKIREDRRKG